MSEDEKVKYFKTALALVGVTTDERTCNVIILTYERFLKLGADFSVRDAVQIEAQNEKKYQNIQP